MMRFLQWLHRWTSLIIGVQVMIWLITGMYFSIAGHRTLEAHQYRQQTHVHDALQSASTGTAMVPLKQLPLTANTIQSVSVRLVHGEPQYVISTERGTEYFNASTGALWHTSAELATQIAQAGYRGPGRVSYVSAVANSDEIYGWQGPGYRVNFADDLATRIYVDSASGTIVDHRNKLWVFGDWAFRLHFMDYSGARNFNHLLMVSAALFMLWFALSGLILLGRNLVRGDLNPRQRPSYLAYFQKREQPIASACGGGGTCGLCTVRFSANVPAPNAADKQLLTDSQLAQGIRLGCQHRFDAKAKVSVVNQGAEQLNLVLQHKRQLSPSVSELTFSCADRAEPFAYQAGQFLQFIIPTANEHEPLRRNYSFASAPSRMPNNTFMVAVRSMPAPKPGLNPGVGSSYLLGLQPGATMTAEGPMGEFLLTDTNISQRTQVFIGGGVGVAPLRALIQSELKQSSARPIHFFYGARTPEELCYEQEFRALHAQGVVDYHSCVSEVPEDAESTATGYDSPMMVHELAEQWLAHQHPNHVDVYVCGPPAMLRATLAMLDQLKVPSKHIKFDDFGI